MGTARAAWEALWTCPYCGERRRGFHYQGPHPRWACACGWPLITRHEWDVYWAYWHEMGGHRDPSWGVRWNDLPETRADVLREMRDAAP